jgi:hypothetical protein
MNDSEKRKGKGGEKRGGRAEGREGKGGGGGRGREEMEMGGSLLHGSWEG